VRQNAPVTWVLGLPPVNIPTQGNTGLERGTRLGLAAEEILVSNDTTLSQKTARRVEHPEMGIGPNGWGRSANLLIHSQNHFCPAVEMHIVALRADD
jgi:hypothetical protein